MPSGSCARYCFRVGLSARPFALKTQIYRKERGRINEVRLYSGIRLLPAYLRLWAQPRVLKTAVLPRFTRLLRAGAPVPSRLSTSLFHEGP